MISESDKQLLCSLKSNDEFVHFLQAANLSIKQFEDILQSFMEPKPFMTLSQAEQLNLDMDFSLACNNIKSSQVFSINKEKAIHFPILSETYSETDDSLDQTTGRKEQIVFNVIRKEKQGKMKVSLRASCIKKKIKSMFHKYIIKKLNSLQSQFSTSFKPLPKILSVSLNLKDNKRWSQMTLRELMKYDNIVLTGFDSINKVNNISLLSQKKSEAIEAYLDLKWTSMYEQFLLSSELSDAIKRMEITDKSYALRFQKQSFSLINYIEH